VMNFDCLVGDEQPASAAVKSQLLIQAFRHKHSSSSALHAITAEAVTVPYARKGRRATACTA